MNVIRLGTLREFWERYPEAQSPMNDWFRKCRKAQWHSIQDVRGIYSHADAVKAASGRTATIFNVGGNKYRIITLIDYRFQRMLITHVLTHREYDTNKWKAQV